MSTALLNELSESLKTLGKQAPASPPAASNVTELVPSLHVSTGIPEANGIEWLFQYPPPTSQEAGVRVPSQVQGQQRRPVQSWVGMLQTGLEGSGRNQHRAAGGPEACPRNTPGVFSMLLPLIAQSCSVCNAFTF